jgi:hypothetical protein
VGGYGEASEKEHGAKDDTARILSLKHRHGIAPRRTE